MSCLRTWRRRDMWCPCCLEVCLYDKVEMIEAGYRITEAGEVIMLKCPDCGYVVETAAEGRKETVSE